VNGNSVKLKNTVNSTIEVVKRRVKEGRYRYTIHGLERSIERKISPNEVADAIMSGEIIEEYAQDKYGPSCLILGFAGNNRPLHIQCSYPTRTIVKVVTVYEPDPDDRSGCHPWAGDGHHDSRAYAVPAHVRHHEPQGGVARLARGVHHITAAGARRIRIGRARLEV